MKVGDKVVNYICRDRSFENMRCENDAVLVTTVGIFQSATDVKIDHGQLGSICRDTSFDSEDYESSVQLCLKCRHTSFDRGLWK